MFRFALILTAATPLVWAYWASLGLKPYQAPPIIKTSFALCLDDGHTFEACHRRL